MLVPLAAAVASARHLLTRALPMMPMLPVPMPMLLVARRPPAARAAPAHGDAAAAAAAPSRSRSRHARCPASDHPACDAGCCCTRSARQHAHALPLSPFVIAITCIHYHLPIEIGCCANEDVPAAMEKSEGVISVIEGSSKAKDGACLADQRGIKYSRNYGNSRTNSTKPRRNCSQLYFGQPKQISRQARHPKAVAMGPIV